jgi:hypothetical protein
LTGILGQKCPGLSHSGSRPTRSLIESKVAPLGLRALTWVAPQNLRLNLVARPVGTPSHSWVSAPRTPSHSGSRAPVWILTGILVAPQGLLTTDSGSRASITLTYLGRPCDLVTLGRAQGPSVILGSRPNKDLTDPRSRASRDSSHSLGRAPVWT